MQSRLLVWCVGTALAFGCGETRTLDLLPKKPPMPPPAEACGDLDKCPPDRSLCVDGQCVQCAEDAQCAPDKPACLDNVCVQCRADEQCPMDKVCHLAAFRCTEPCADSTQCKDKSRSTCDVVNGWCVECTVDGECGDKHVCDEAINACVGCTADGDCFDGGVCDPERQECAM